MKPISITARNHRRFPLVEWNYQPVMLGGYRSRCIKSEAPSFRNISHEYFHKEVRRDFVGEVIIFAVIAATAVAPLLSTASALSEFCRAIGQL
jgi:hypothetical protein